MNIVCRLMCKDELIKFLNGEVIKKQNNGEDKYSHLVGDKLSFTPLKYNDQVSLGDIAVILHNMTTFVAKDAFENAQKRNSPLYLMVATVDDNKIKFKKHMGGQYVTSYHEYSKELLTSSYSLQNCKPWQLYEINIDKNKWLLSTSDYEDALEHYTPLVGFPIITSSYCEAMNDCLSKIYSEKQIKELYNKLDLPALISDIEEQIDKCDDFIDYNYESLGKLKETLYGPKNNKHEIEYSLSPVPNGFATKKEIEEYSNATGNTSLMEMFEFMDSIFLDYAQNFNNVIYNFKGSIDSNSNFSCSYITALTDNNECLEVDLSTGEIIHKFKNAWNEYEEEIIQDDDFNIMDVDKKIENIELACQPDFLELRSKGIQQQKQTPLQQRETVLSLLETEAQTLTQAESLIDKLTQKQNRDTGE